MIKSTNKILIALTAVILFLVLSVDQVYAADNMCNVDRQCKSKSDWDRGWHDARKSGNRNKKPTRTERDNDGKTIRKKGESNKVNRSKAAAKHAKETNDKINPKKVTHGQNAPSTASSGGGSGKGTGSNTPTGVDNMCNVTLDCKSDADWKKGHRQARKAKNGPQVAKQTEFTNDGAVIQYAGNKKDPPPQEKKQSSSEIPEIPGQVSKKPFLGAAYCNYGGGFYSSKGCSQTAKEIGAKPGAECFNQDSSSGNPSRCAKGADGQGYYNTKETVNKDTGRVEIEVLVSGQGDSCPQGSKTSSGQCWIGLDAAASKKAESSAVRAAIPENQTRNIDFARKELETIQSNSQAKIDRVWDVLTSPCKGNAAEKRACEADKDSSIREERLNHSEVDTVDYLITATSVVESQINSLNLCLEQGTDINTCKGQVDRKGIPTYILPTLNSYINRVETGIVEADEKAYSDYLTTYEEKAIEQLKLDSFTRDLVKDPIKVEAMARVIAAGDAARASCSLSGAKTRRQGALCNISARTELLSYKPTEFLESVSEIYHDYSLTGYCNEVSNNLNSCKQRNAYRNIDELNALTERAQVAEAAFTLCKGLDGRSEHDCVEGRKTQTLEVLNTEVVGREFDKMCSGPTLTRSDIGVCSTLKSTYSVDEQEGLIYAWEETAKQACGGHEGSAYYVCAQQSASHIARNSLASIEKGNALALVEEYAVGRDGTANETLYKQLLGVDLTLSLGDLQRTTEFKALPAEVQSQIRADYQGLVETGKENADSYFNSGFTSDRVQNLDYLLGYIEKDQSLDIDLIRSTLTQPTFEQALATFQQTTFGEQQELVTGLKVARDRVVALETDVFGGQSPYRGLAETQSRLQETEPGAVYTMDDYLEGIGATREELALYDELLATHDSFKGQTEGSLGKYASGPIGKLQVSSPIFTTKLTNTAKTIGTYAEVGFKNVIVPMYAPPVEKRFETATQYATGEITLGQAVATTFPFAGANELLDERLGDIRIVRGNIADLQAQKRQALAARNTELVTDLNTQIASQRGDLGELLINQGQVAAFNHQRTRATQLDSESPLYVQGIVTNAVDYSGIDPRISTDQLTAEEREILEVSLDSAVTYRDTQDRRTATTRVINGVEIGGAVIAGIIAPEFEVASDIIISAIASIAREALTQSQGEITQLAFDKGGYKEQRDTLRAVNVAQSLQNVGINTAASIVPNAGFIAVGKSLRITADTAAGGFLKGLLRGQDAVDAIPVVGLASVSDSLTTANRVVTQDLVVDAVIREAGDNLRLVKVGQVVDGSVAKAPQSSLDNYLSRLTLERGTTQVVGIKDNILHVRVGDDIYGVAGASIDNSLADIFVDLPGSRVPKGIVGETFAGVPVAQAVPPQPAGGQVVTVTGADTPALRTQPPPEGSVSQLLDRARRQIDILKANGVVAVDKAALRKAATLGLVDDDVLKLGTKGAKARAGLDSPAVAVVPNGATGKVGALANAKVNQTLPDTPALVGTATKEIPKTAPAEVGGLSGLLRRQPREVGVWPDTRGPLQRLATGPEVPMERELFGPVELDLGVRFSRSDDGVVTLINETQGQVSVTRGGESFVIVQPGDSVVVRPKDVIVDSNLRSALIDTFDDAGFGRIGMTTGVASDTLPSGIGVAEPPLLYGFQGDELGGDFIDELGDPNLFDRMWGDDTYDLADGVVGRADQGSDKGELLRWAYDVDGNPVRIDDSLAPADGWRTRLDPFTDEALLDPFDATAERIYRNIGGGQGRSGQEILDEVSASIRGFNSDVNEVLAAGKYHLEDIEKIRNNTAKKLSKGIDAGEGANLGYYFVVGEIPEGGIREASQVVSACPGNVCYHDSVLAQLHASRYGLQTEIWGFEATSGKGHSVLVWWDDFGEGWVIDPRAGTKAQPIQEFFSQYGIAISDSTVVGDLGPYVPDDPSGLGTLVGGKASATNRLLGVVDDDITVFSRSIRIRPGGDLPQPPPGAFSGLSAPQGPVQQLFPEGIGGLGGIADDIGDAAERLIDGLTPASRGPVIVDLVEGPPPSAGKLIGETKASKVYGNRTTGKATKIFDVHSLGDDYTARAVNNQIDYLQKLDGKYGSPRVIENAYDTDGRLIGYQMDYLRGESLADYAARGGKLTPDQARQAIAAYDDIVQITGRGHGDLAFGGKLTKPDHVWIFPDDSVTYIDPGTFSDEFVASPKLLGDERDSLIAGIDQHVGHDAAPGVVEDIKDAGLDVLGAPCDPFVFNLIPVAYAASRPPCPFTFPDITKGVRRLFGGGDEILPPLTPPEKVAEVTARMVDADVKLMRVVDAEVQVRVGIDPEGELAGGGGASYFLEPGQSLPGDVQIVDRAGNLINLNAADTPVPFVDIEEVIIAGESYELLRDVWNNPALYKRTSVEINPQFEVVANDVADMWDAAVRSADELDDFLEGRVDPVVLARIRSTVDYVKRNPGLTFFVSSRTGLDPWEFAKLSPNDPAVVGALFRLEGTGVYDDFVRVTEKIRGGQALDEADRVFLDAYANASLAERQGIHGSRIFEVTEFNEKYALANMAENYFLRELLPGESISLHQNQTNQFLDLMRQRGLSVDEWLTPYRGEEIIFGIEISGFKANSNGEFFFSSQMETPESVADIIGHERLHKWQLASRELSGFEAIKGYRSDESYTEALRLLMKHQGDVGNALLDNATTRSAYASGVDELLRIVQDINQSSGDDLLGTELLFRGIADISQGEARYSLGPIISYYDQRLVPGGFPSFESRMGRFSDSGLPSSGGLGPDFYQPTDLPRQELTRVLKGIDYETVRLEVGDLSLSVEDFDKAVQLRVDGPEVLISGYSPSAHNDYLLNVVRADPKAARELQTFFDDYYSQYSQAIRTVAVEDIARNVARLEELGPASRVFEDVKDAGLDVLGAPCDPFAFNLIPVAHAVYRPPCPFKFTDIPEGIKRVFGGGDEVSGVAPALKRVDSSNLPESVAPILRESGTGNRVVTGVRYEGGGQVFVDNVDSPSLLMIDDQATKRVVVYAKNDVNPASVESAIREAQDLHPDGFSVSPRTKALLGEVVLEKAGMFPDAQGRMIWVQDTRPRPIVSDYAVVGRTTDLDTDSIIFIVDVKGRKVGVSYEPQTRLIANVSDLPDGVSEEHVVAAVADHLSKETGFRGVEISPHIAGKFDDLGFSQTPYGINTYLPIHVPVPSTTILQRIGNLPTGILRALGIGVVGGVAFVKTGAIEYITPDKAAEDFPELVPASTDVIVFEDQSSQLTISERSVTILTTDDSGQVEESLKLDADILEISATLSEITLPKSEIELALEELGAGLLNPTDVGVITLGTGQEVVFLGEGGHVVNQQDISDALTALEKFAPFYSYLNNFIYIRQPKIEVESYTKPLYGIVNQWHRDLEGNYLPIIRVGDNYTVLTHFESDYIELDFENGWSDLNLAHEYAHAAQLIQDVNGAVVRNELFVRFIELFYEGKQVSEDQILVYTRQDLGEWAPTHYSRTGEDEVYSEDLADSMALYSVAPEVLKESKPLRYHYLACVAKTGNPKECDIVEMGENGKIIPLAN